MNTSCRTVFSFPPEDAGITAPRRTMTNRSSVTPNSRTMITIVTHHGTVPSIERSTSAVIVRALSAMGSAILPKSVTSPRDRAR